MSHLPLTYAPHPIFKKKAIAVEMVDDEIRALVDGMLKTMAVERAVGMGANMVGVLKQVAVVDLCEDGISRPYVFINPVVKEVGQEVQINEEASICFPGIAAEIPRHECIVVEYLDQDGARQTLEASGFFAAVIQHEVDYLNGVTFLDYLSKLKRDRLLQKMKKYMKENPPSKCRAGCCH